MKQKHYRVYLYPDANGICNELAIHAVKSNGNPSKWITIEELEMIFKVELLKFPNMNTGYHINVISPNCLTVDYTSTKQNWDTNEPETKVTCALAIEQVNLFTLVDEEQPPYLRKEESIC